MTGTDPNPVSPVAAGNILGALASCVADCLASYATVY